MKGILLGSLSLMFAGPSVLESSLCQFVPPNDRYIPIAQKAADATGLTEAEFNSVLDRLEKIYAPIIKDKGGTLEIKRLWSDGTVNASAERLGTTYRINMYGGLARHKLITPDGFLLVACHEMGHHLGGKPKYSSWWPPGSESWASVEGQSDYFSSAKCMRRMYLDMTSTELGDFARENTFAEEQCKEVYTDTDDITKCVRSSEAGIVLGNVLGDLGGAPLVDLETPSAELANGIYQNHPKAQCRADTYFQGALCTLAHDVEFSDSNQLTGACTAESGFTEGLRPKCWFNPKKGPGRAPLDLKAVHQEKVYY